MSVGLFVQAQGCSLGWWDDDLDIFPESLAQTVGNSGAVIGPIGQKPGHGAFHPDDELGQGGFVADLVFGQQGGDDLAAVRIVPDV